jgi:hypothetical protein
MQRCLHPQHRQPPNEQPFVSNVVDHDMNIQACRAARFSKGSFPGCDLYAEARIPDVVGGRDDEWR